MEERDAKAYNGENTFIEDCDAMAYTGQSMHLWRNGTPGLINGNVYIYRKMGHQGL